MSYTYYISASKVGSGLGESSYLLYKDACGLPDGTLITQVTKQELLDGFAVSLDRSVEKIYLIPVLDDPLANNCILGCGNDWAEHYLSNFTPTPTPTVTITPTVTATPTLTPTPTITPSSTPAGSSNYLTPFGDHILRRIDSTTVEFEVVGTTYQRYSIANSIANAFGDGNVTINTSEPMYNNYAVYTEDETFIVSLVKQGGTTTQVSWYDSSGEGTAYVRLSLLDTLPSFSPPTGESNLKYLPI